MGKLIDKVDSKLLERYVLSIKAIQDFRIGMSSHPLSRNIQTRECIAKAANIYRSLDENREKLHEEILGQAGVTKEDAEFNLELACYCEGIAMFNKKEGLTLFF